MSKILVVAEHQAGALKKSTFQSLTLARQLAARTGQGIDFVIVGDGIASLANELTAYGASTIHTVEGPAYASYLAQSWSGAIAQVAREIGASYVVSSSSTTGKDCLPRVAAILGAGMVADCTGLAGEGAEILYKRPMYAGNILATVRANTSVVLITARGSEFDAAAPEGGGGTVQAFAAAEVSSGSRFVGFDGAESDRPQLGDADVVIAGGRGLKDEENFFGIVEPLADALGGAIGASRAAVDSGFCPNDMQVGQTGKIVAPKLYFAIALSGAIQHLAGMKNSKTIVAINKDEEAPIFQVSDYGLVADAFTAVPELVEKLKAL